MPTSLRLNTTRCNDGRLVLSAAGEIDLSNIDAFSQALSTASAEAAGSGGTLTVDLSAVEYLDSAAINALFVSADHIHLIAHPSRNRKFSPIKPLPRRIHQRPGERPLAMRFSRVQSLDYFAAIALPWQSCMDARGAEKCVLDKKAFRSSNS